MRKSSVIVVVIVILSILACVALVMLIITWPQHSHNVQDKTVPRTQTNTVAVDVPPTPQVLSKLIPSKHEVKLKLKPSMASRSHYINRFLKDGQQDLVPVEHITNSSTQHTAYVENSNCWIKLDLGRDRRISRIIVHHTPDLNGHDHATEASLTVRNTATSAVYDAKLQDSQVDTFLVNKIGRFIQIRNPRVSSNPHDWYDRTYLSLREVEVFVKDTET